MSKFSMDDTEPVIVRLIEHKHQQTGNYVAHDELVQEMLEDDLGKRLVDSAVHEDDEHRDGRWWASNMIQWFSQRITAEKSPYQGRFEREDRNGAWAYRPKESSA